MLGNSEISRGVSKVTRIDETTFEITRTLVGKAALNDSPLKIEKTNITISSKSESVYRVQIDYRGAIRATTPVLSDFYIYNNNILYYEKGKLYYGTTK